MSSCAVGKPEGTELLLVSRQLAKWRAEEYRTLCGCARRQRSANLRLHAKMENRT
jgi:hypothetical protein